MLSKLFGGFQWFDNLDIFDSVLFFDSQRHPEFLSMSKFQFANFNFQFLISYCIFSKKVNWGFYAPQTKNITFRIKHFLSWTNDTFCPISSNDSYSLVNRILDLSIKGVKDTAVIWESVCNSEVTIAGLNELIVNRNKKVSLSSLLQGNYYWLIFYIGSEGYLLFFISYYYIL